MMQANVGTCPYCSRRHGREHRCEAEFKAWEIDYELREKEDYAGLIAHYMAIVEWCYDGLHGLHELGEIYVLNGEPEKAVKLLANPHREHPWNQEFQYVILDALFAMGKDETDFDWVKQIPVFRLGSNVLDRCYVYLKPKRKLRTAYDLHTELTIEGYCVFSPEELLEVVRRDQRFVVQEGDLWSPGIRARRKHDRRPREQSSATVQGERPGADSKTLVEPKRREGDL